MIHKIKVKSQKARYEDIEFLVGICRKCLADQRIWQGTRTRAKKWWRLVIDSDFVEVWIFVHKDQRVGFCKLVTDMEEHDRLERNYKQSLFEKMLTFFIFPISSTIKLIQKIGKAYTIKHDVSFLNKTFLWAGPIAVMPNMQGKGIGTDILQFIVERGKVLGVDCLQLGVAKRDKKAIRLYEKSGYLKTYEIRHYFYMARPV